jgi:hypothetical protein
VLILNLRIPKHLIARLILQSLEDVAMNSQGFVLSVGQDDEMHYKLPTRHRKHSLGHFAVSSLLRAEHRSTVLLLALESYSLPA